jgi:hypothetical protein
MGNESAGDGDDRRYAPVLEGRGKAEVFGFPSPPRECFPSRDDCVAICGFTVIYRNLPILGVRLRVADTSLRPASARQAQLLR